jgi:hypothetical protein
VGIAAGYYHTAAVQSNGNVRCWGDNSYNQLSVPANLGPIIQIASDGYHTLVLTSTYGVKCWGRNTYGQCTLPTGLDPVDGLAAGGNHTTALMRVLPPCAGDINDDRAIDGADLGAMLTNWGTATAGEPSDMNNDGKVDGADLGALLTRWGVACPL